MACCMGDDDHDDEGLGDDELAFQGPVEIMKDQLLERDHTWGKAIFIACSLSLCITVDILQYSMPLAFLPSVLEDRGHSTIKIASAIGVYYWMGFVGGVLLTSYQVSRLYFTCGETLNDTTTLSTVTRYVKYLIFGLLIGTITLSVQAMSPRYNVHLVCRFIQGFAGAFIFFYTFLLSATLFKGGSEQQDFAMTAASTALNIAEVLGSLFGAVLFEVWGQRSVFWFLCVASVINQVLLVGVIYTLEPAEEVEVVSPTSWDTILKRRKSGWKRVKGVFSGSRLHVAVILIVTAAIVKGSVEEMLPFHADHQWGLDPLEIGQLFAIVAFAYIGAAAAVGRGWRLIHRFRIPFSAGCLVALGMAAAFVFILREYDMSKVWLYAALAIYGVFLGMTHTPAALLLADAIEYEEGAAKDAVNGIWNTMWEAGGSLGFLLGGLLAHRYEGQMRLTMGTAALCVVAAGLLMMVGSLSEKEPAEMVSLASLKEANDKLKDAEKPANGQKQNYGATA